MPDRRSLTRYAWLSISAAVLTMALKGAAFLLTRSVGLLSDALESAVNLGAGLMALSMLSIGARPPDEDHAYGHAKAEYFSSGAEGALIMIAAAGILFAAVPRLLSPQPLERLELGLGISLVASLVNFGVARILTRAGRRHHSIALEADAQHLLTDVGTSAGVLVGIGAVAVTGWEILDPLIALAVAGLLAWSGLRLVRRSTLGLMDTALPPEEIHAVEAALQTFSPQGVRYHALRPRQAGARSFVSVHIQVPGRWSIQRGHNLLEAIEDRVRRAIPNASVFTHIEPVEDPASWKDATLDREDGEGSEAKS